ncbi:MAG: hypothetical protein MJ211_01525 [Bacteroidales bacterium]|nr:hypothetical protein [Bacteroidales bacterium]
MKQILFTIFILIGLSINTIFAQNLKTNLENIRYYENQGCSSEYPIKVRICFTTNSKKPETLQFIVSYSKTITYTGPVKEYSENKIYYSFCCKIGETNVFDITIVDKKGNRSQTVTISSLANDKNIIKTDKQEEKI